MPTMTPETFEQMLQKQRNKGILYVDSLNFNMILNQYQKTIHSLMGKETFKTENGDVLVIPRITYPQNS